MPENDINLVPQEVQEKKGRAERQKAVIIGSVTVFLVTASMSVGLLVANFTLTQSINQTEAAIERRKALISSQASIENLVRRIEMKFGAAEEILSERRYYSKLFDELPGMFPTGAKIESLSISGNEVNINAAALSTIDVAKFLRVIVDEERGGKLFSGVQLTSVGIDGRSGMTRFSFVLTLREGVLLQ